MDEYELDDRLSEDEGDVDFCVNDDDILPDVSSDDIQDEEAMRTTYNKGCGCSKNYVSQFEYSIYRETVFGL